MIEFEPGDQKKVEGDSGMEHTVIEVSDPNYPGETTYTIEPADPNYTHNLN